MSSSGSITSVSRYVTQVFQIAAVEIIAGQVILAEILAGHS